MESVRLKINEHMTSVGEEMLCVLDKQQLKLNVRVFVLERLSAAAEFMCNLFQREIETLHNTKLHTAVFSTDHHRERSTVSGEMASKRYSTLLEEQREMDQGRGLFDARLKPVVKLCRIDFPHLPVCKEVSPEQPVVQEEPQHPLSKEEQADGFILTSLAVESEDDDENRETEPVASTSTEHMKTQADTEDCGTSQATADDQLISSHCSESDTEDIDEDWEETREGHLALSTLHSQKTQTMEGQRLSLSKTLSQDLKSSKQTHSMRSHTGKKRLSCTISSKGRGQKCDVKQHLRTQPGEKPFTCEFCGKCFSLKGSLNSHMRTHKGAAFICEVCGKCCSQRGNLDSHMRSHTGEKPFTCTVCCKGFSQICGLKLHMTTHTGDKPFTCSVCGKSFNHSSHLKTHMRIHTEEKPYICAVCGKGFPIIGYLKSHMKTHTGEKPLSCTVCGKAFSQRSNLNIHMRTHTREKPFNCTVCGKGFSQKSYIKIHMRVHTGERPFTCTFCAEQFGQTCHLQKHMRRKHAGRKHL